MRKDQALDDNPSNADEQVGEEVEPDFDREEEETDG